MEENFRRRSEPEAGFVFTCVFWSDRPRGDGVAVFVLELGGESFWKEFTSLYLCLHRFVSPCGRGGFFVASLQ